MTRGNLEYTVYGETKDEISSEILRVYREFMEVDDKELPRSTHVNIEPSEVITTGDGQVSYPRWEARVSISLYS